MNLLLSLYRSAFFLTFVFASGLLLMAMTSMPWMSSSGSPCSKRFMRSSTTTTWNARRGWSVKSWRRRNTSATFPRRWSLDSSKFIFWYNNTSQHVIIFRLARYLEVLNMPDDFRELLDEYLDASERSVGQKECEEFFQCPYSLKDSVKRNFSGNSL